MGQQNARPFRPITSKVSAHYQNEKYCAGSSCMMGCRTTMEDYHTSILSLPDDPGTSFFGVFDGHGGNKIAEYAGMNLHKVIVGRPEYQEHTKEAIKQAFLELDHHIRSKYVFSERTVGSTAVIVLIKENKLYCANAGDSHAVVCIKGVAHVMTVNHRPVHPEELKRIELAGGIIIGNRVNAKLGITRAFGDFAFKMDGLKTQEEQVIIAIPDISVRDITEDYEFVVLASDGIWDVMTYQPVVDFCRTRLIRGFFPDEVCEELMNLCIDDYCVTYPKGPRTVGGDNMTVVIVCFLRGLSYEEFTSSLPTKTTTMTATAATAL